MGKHEEIREDYKAARARFFTNRDRCYKFMDDLVGYMAEFLECDAGHITYYRTNTRFHPGESVSKEEAMEMGSDGGWHLRIGITFPEDPDKPASDTVYADIDLLLTPGGFELRFRDVHEPFRIPPDYKKITPAHTAFLERLYKGLKPVYAEGVRAYPVKGRSGQRIRL